MAAPKRTLTDESGHGAVAYAAVRMGQPNRASGKSCGGTVGLFGVLNFA